MWLAAGLALGLGMLTKYTILFLYVSFGLYLLLVDRRWWRTPWPYLAFGIAILCLAGVFYWNWANDWVSFRHTSAIGLPDRNSVGRALGRFFEYFGVQAGVTSPILFVLYLWGIGVCARRLRENRDAAYLFLCFVVVFGAFAIATFTRNSYPNWPVCAYLAAAPAFAWVWCERPRGRRPRRWLVAGLVLGGIIGLAARSTGLVYTLGIPLDPDRDPTNKLFGGKELGVALSKYPVNASNGPFICSDRYQLTALAAFYTTGRPRTYCINTGMRRLNQYDLWGGWE